ncbi:Adenosylcobinamide-phosphate synthase [Furfurilactobacillus rossiae]|uniref:adenosylcobinamide-phosphate synthase CbiB n=1 Tax=Furfurilactobacillus rossiae TaxID=231049 RepID=UPI0015B885A2|nr:adenosylcobinamide-phosphate synthase CbiB [Furfurilactobacillus rossiae]MCF6165859.1 adenosylcobinamide-phosphate synthase CbiB [Furfurilactobacillus rossiae]QLE64424.1 Adenosylcobinamide-phosphate synthase [Furfurilactobacillus rossiae]
MLIEMILIAYVLDLLIGDPPTWPHPVKIMGHLIAFLEGRLNRPKFGHLKRRWLGVLLWVIVVGSTALVSGLIMWATSFVPWLQFIIGTYLTYTCLSVKGLAHEGRKIAKSLRQQQLVKARGQVAMIVGRDTDQLDEAGVIKATVETIAENTSDGVVAPLLFLFIGGPVLGLTYKAVNTLDSMVGYKNEKYADIGWFSAKLDDIFNWLPARLTWLLLIIATGLLRFHLREAMGIGERDRENHLSPNSGFSEAVVAGALNIRLGGPHLYFGQVVQKPYIGSRNSRPVEVVDINRTIYLLYLSSVLALGLMAGSRLLIQMIW